MIAELRAKGPHELNEFTRSLKKQVKDLVVDKIPHLESSLAVAELTVALHYTMHTPEDILIWDVSHQAYFHKALTGRLALLEGQRKTGGISGFTSREESDFDAFGAGHASTSISALAGMAQAHKLQSPGTPRKFVAVIGDGSMTGGMSFEALNHAATLGLDLHVIINDNRLSIDPTVGALHQRNSYQAYVESLGWEYTKATDGNNTELLAGQLATWLEKKGPQVLHVSTEKELLSSAKSKKYTTFQKIAGEALESVFEQHQKLTLLSPAMLYGGGLSGLAKSNPSRVIDTGINEPHTVTMGAGMAAAGVPTIVHIYSTFLQRAIDQVLHDVALQKLPMVFLVDRAGVVGADGATHNGVFDLGMLADVPGATIWNPKDGGELRSMLLELRADEFWKSLGGPLFIRYPKEETKDVRKPSWSPLQVLEQCNSNTLLISTGWLSQTASMPFVDHVHLAQMLPIPEALLETIAGYETVITMEEANGYGGLSGVVAQLISAQDLEVKHIVRKIPHKFTEHGDRKWILEHYGLLPNSKR